jgi:hypothetical protein
MQQSVIHNDRKKRGRLAALAIALGLVIGTIAAPAPAFAYTTTGCKWSTGDLRIDWRYVNGNFRTAFSYARNQYTSGTDVNLSTMDESGPTFKAQNSNYGATGYEANANWTCPFGSTNSATVRINQYYLAGLEPATRLKVVWQHEIGHALGLDHVTTRARVMYTSASSAYSAGVTGLTSDEVTGINALY